MGLPYWRNQHRWSMLFFFSRVYKSATPFLGGQFFYKQLFRVLGSRQSLCSETEVRIFLKALLSLFPLSNDLWFVKIYHFLRGFFCI